MANAVWPAELPKAFVVSPFEGSMSPKPTVITEMDGATKTRGRFTAAEDPFTGTMEMDRDQLIRFIQFFQNDIGDPLPGTRWGQHKFQGLSHPVFETDAVWLFNVPAPTYSAQGPLAYLVTMNLLFLPEDPE